MIQLSDITIETCCTIEELNHETEMKRRLLDLGIMKGAEIKPILAGAFHGMRAYRIKGTTIALRNREASQIIVSIKQ